MAIRTEWYDEGSRRAIILSFQGDWDLEDYDNAIEHSIRLLNSVKHPVAIIIDLSESTGSSKSPEVFQKWQEAIVCWQATDSYADFWVSVQAKYWEYFLIWLLSRVYNPTSMDVTQNSEEAYQKIIKRLNTSTTSNQQS